MLLVESQGHDRLTVALLLRGRPEKDVQPLEVRCGALRALFQEIPVGPIAEHQIAGFEAKQPRDGLLKGHFELKGRQGLAGDVSVRPDQVIHGEQTPGSDTDQRQDNQRRCRETFWTPTACRPRDLPGRQT
jgi:hypothetical protein